MSVSSRRRFLTNAGLALAGCALGRNVRGAEPAWADERTYGPFHCRATFRLAPLEDFFNELSHLEQELHRTLAAPATSESVDLFLLADERSHRGFLAELYPRVPYRRALYVRRGAHGTVYAYQHAELPIDLRHECTHALLHANLAAIPLWLDEGLAEYFEMPQSERAFDHPHLATLRWNLRLGRVKSIELLEAGEALGDMGGAEYRYAWAWVHFMLHGPVAAHRTLVQYLADLRRGEQPEPLSTRLHAAVPALNDGMIQHFRHWRRS